MSLSSVCNATVMAFALFSGAPIPQVGLGVYRSEPGAETYAAVLQGIQLGYRHIDTAQFYKNEADVGRAITNCGVDRKDIFVTTKVTPFAMASGEKAYASVIESLSKLQTGYIDLVLLHAPGESHSRADAWAALEKAQVGVRGIAATHIHTHIHAF